MTLPLRLISVGGPIANKRFKSHWLHHTYDIMDCVLKCWSKPGTPPRKRKYLHLVELGPVKGVRFNFPEAISIQHPAAVIKKSCHFSQNTSDDENISHVFISAPALCSTNSFHMLWGSARSQAVEPNGFFKILTWGLKLQTVATSCQISSISQLRILFPVFVWTWALSDIISDPFLLQ